MGTAAIQICNAIGAQIIAIAGGEQKLEKAKDLGARLIINRNDGPFETKVKAFTNDKGVDVILDCVGYPYVPQHMSIAAVDCRWVQFGLLVSKMIL